MISMVDIYDELGYIKEVLSKGPSPTRWERDAKLLARFYASEGIKKSEAKQILTKKCETYCKETFNRYRDYKRLNKAIDEAYKMNKQGKKLRAIKEIVISKEVLDWFLNLDETFEISEEKALEITTGRKIKIKTKPLNFARVRMLFTLYVWTLIQSDYVNVPNVHYIKGCMKKFKTDADLSSSFSVNKEKDVLKDLGFLYINGKQGIDAIFINEYDVFKTPITEDNKIVIAGDDIYNCGFWLEKQKYGSYICEYCGREFAFKGKGKGEKSRKYCNDCFKELYGKMETKTKICVDCGNPFLASSLDNTSVRCSNCQEEHRRKIKREYMRRVKEKKS